MKNKYLNSSDLQKLGVSCGTNCLVHESVIVNNYKLIKLGKSVRIDAFTVLITKNKKIKIGSYVHIGSHCYLSGQNGIELKNFSGLGQGVKIYSVNDDYSGLSLTNPTTKNKNQKKFEKAGKVEIGKHVNIGANSIVLPNVKIGNGASVGSLSLVKSNLKGWYIYFGIPVSALFKRSKEILSLERNFLKNEKKK
tara:strand:- start:1857 stop:2438 length:582 start_codon:yes stop_codon:yes gene_type:complete